MPELSFLFEMVSVVAGAIGGALLGLAGGVGGTRARRGERPSWVGVLFGVVATLGILTFVSGFVAGGLNQPPRVWIGQVVVGAVLIFLAWRINRHVNELRAEARASQQVVTSKDDLGARTPPG